MAWSDPCYGDRGSDHIEIRLANPSDRIDLERLAVLDSKRQPSGPTLVALVNGTLAAALPLDGSAALADPFRATEGLVCLLRFRADELADELSGSRLPPLRRFSAHLRGAASS